MNIYDDMREALQQELADNSEQGTIRYIHPGEPTGPDYDPQPGTPTAYPVLGVVRGVSQKYIDGTYVKATDQQATLAAFERAPTTEGVLEVDGVERQIIRVDNLPGAGSAVGHRVFIKG